jgi:ABC-type nickel/cobalt efflux system permease component RcnA
MDGLVSILLFGLLLGVRHALEPDHVIAVSTIASRSSSIWRSALAGVFWGVGHTATLVVVSLLLLLGKREMPETVAMSLEFAVGVMLVALGLRSLLVLRVTRLRANWHAHGEEVHRHYLRGQAKGHRHETGADREQSRFYSRAVLVGCVHGLAGSAAMFVLTMTTVETWWAALLYLLIFGIGTVIGMFLFTTLIGLPFLVSAKRPAVQSWLAAATASVSTVFGCYSMYNLGVTEGLFQRLFS